MRRGRRNDITSCRSAKFSVNRFRETCKFGNIIHIDMPAICAGGNQHVNAANLRITRFVIDMMFATDCTRMIGETREVFSETIKLK